MPPWPEILTGEWSYRAFKTETDLSIPFNDLRFATATLTLSASVDGAVSGALKGEGWGTWIAWSLNLEGRHDSSNSVQFEGTNEIGGDQWVYAYQGSLAPILPDAADPHFVLTGTVMRSLTRTHLPGEAGVHATFIAVKREHHP